MAKSAKPAKAAAPRRGGNDNGDTQPTERLANLTDEEHAERLRAAARDQLAADVEAFLAGGGKIETIPRDLRADPPRKPQNNYGKGSI